MSLSETHKQYLLDQGISEHVIRTSGIYSNETEAGICFPWSDGERTEIQFRPDNPSQDENGKPLKYIGPKGVQLPFNVLSNYEDAGAPVVVVEGTKQQYAVLSHGPSGYSVYGLSGCWNWKGLPLDWAEDRKVYILFDGDVTTNRKVYEAGQQFKMALEANGAEEVLFVITSAQNSEGVDDVLARLAPEKRERFMKRWLDMAKAKPVDKPPAHKAANPYFNKEGLKVQSLANDLLAAHKAALTAEDKVALYIDGCYRTHNLALMSAVERRLEEQHRASHLLSVEQSIKSQLYIERLRLPERSPEPLVNFLNGMVDLRTGELLPHDPSYLSRTQFPVMWNPEAQCPVYERWAMEVIPEQWDDLEESAATMLDRSRTPSKAVFLYGPSHSGKSTFLRIMEWVCGRENMSAVTLHQLSDDRFAAANVYGKALNAAADLSSKDVADLSIFKMMTGEDTITGNRKYGGQFEFLNTALFAFSANELPQVGESSKAYANRIKPFLFPNSFAGKEDINLEAKMKAEVEGILVRWVRAYQRFLTRGGYAESNAAVRAQFEERSDRVRQWLGEQMMVIDSKTQGSTPSELAQVFDLWCKDNNMSQLGRNKLMDRLRNCPGVWEVRIGATKKRGLNIVKRTGGDPFDPDSEGPEVVALLEPTTAKKVAVSNSVAVPETATDGGSKIEVAEVASDGGSFEGGGSSGGQFQNGKSHHETAGQTEEVAVVAVLEQPCSWGEKVKEEGVRNEYREGASKTATTATNCHRGFDIETGSADDLWQSPNPDFVRLIGFEDGATHNVTAVGDALSAGTRLVGHNLFGYDFQALSRHAGVSYDDLAANAIDVRLQAWIADPPTTWETSAGPNYKSYSLDAISERVLGEPKDERGKALVKEFGSWDAIPADDPRYVQYCRDDADRALRIHKALPFTPYMEREMKIQAIMSRMTHNGFKVNEELVEERISESHDRKNGAMEVLSGTYGIPNTGKSPLASKAGKAALIEAFRAAGAPHYPKTASGEIAAGKEGMEKMLKHYGHIPDVVAIAELVKTVTGTRTVYDTIKKHTHQGRVHPDFWPGQASGRWSVTGPGLTVMGKRGPLAVEREVLVADEGEVLIAVDLGQVDARVVAAHAQDTNYLKLFEPGRDLHSEIALMIFGDVKFRSDAKAIGHGTTYGMGQKKLVEQGHDAEKVAAFFEGQQREFPRLQAWKDEVRELGARTGMLDNGFGRPLRVQPDRAYTQAPAQIGQGGTRDMMAQGMLDLVRNMPEVLPMLRVLVHDEIVLSVPKERAEEIGEVVVKSMHRFWAPFGYEHKVEIISDCTKPAENWYAAYKG